MNRNTRLTKIFMGAMALAAVGGISYTALQSHAAHPLFATALLALAAVTSRMKVKLPGIEGNMSMNLPFLLMAVMSLSAAEAVLIACISTLVQCWPKDAGKFRPEQMLFNISMMGLAASMANMVWSASALSKTSWVPQPLMLAAATAVFFLGQTVPVAGIIHLTEGQSVRKVWMSVAQMSFPYFVLSAGVSSMLEVVTHRFGWQAALAVFPVMYGIHHSYLFYFGQMGQAIPAPAAARASAGGSSS